MKKKRQLVFSKDSDYKHMYVRQSVSILLLNGELRTYPKWVPAIIRKTDRMITIAKKEKLIATRQLKKFLINHEYRPHKSLVYFVVHELAKRYQNRSSGFCTRRIIGRRKGDNSQIVLLKLIKSK